MAHVWEQVSDVLLRLRAGGQTSAIDTEVVTWLNQGYYDIFNVLYDLDRQWVTTTGSLNTTSGTDTYTLPDDVLQIERVTYDASNAYAGDATKYPQCHMWALRDLGDISGPRALFQLSPQGGQPQADRPFAVVVGHQLQVLPKSTATVTSGIRLVYTRKPNELTLNKMKLAVTTTSAGAANGSTVIATALSDPNRDDWWNNCVIIPTDGTSKFERRTISDFTASTGTCAMRNSFGTQIVSAVKFDIFDQSILPEQFHHLAVFWATSMAALKDNNGALHASMMMAYDSRMDRLRQSRRDIVDVKSFASEPVSREKRS